MRKLILLLFLPFCCFAQITNVASNKRSEISAPIYLEKNQVVRMNQDIVDFLTANLRRIKSIGGKTVIYVPIQQEFKKNRRGWFIGRHLYQYVWSNKRDEITFDKIKTTMLEFDFDKDKITTKHQNNDDNSIFKYQNASDKIKEKDKPIKPKPHAIKPRGK